MGNVWYGDVSYFPLVGLAAITLTEHFHAKLPTLPIPLFPGPRQNRNASMSTGSPAPTPQPYPPKPPESETNVWGLIGLLLGIFGFFTWVTAPVGIVLSYIGLKHPRNGIAIAGLIVSIASTVFVAVLLSIVAIFFGSIAAFYAAVCGCCLCSGMQASDQAALRAEVEKVVAEELEKEWYEVDVESFSSNPPFGGDAKTFTGTAVYTDEEGQQMAIDFAGDAEKVDGQWEVNNLNLQGEPYEWVDSFTEEDFGSDDSFDSSIEGIDGTVWDGSAIDGSAPPDDTFNREAPPEDDPFADPEI